MSEKPYIPRPDGWLIARNIANLESIQAYARDHLDIVPKDVMGLLGCTLARARELLADAVALGVLKWVREGSCYAWRSE